MNFLDFEMLNCDSEDSRAEFEYSANGETSPSSFTCRQEMPRAHDEELSEILCEDSHTGLDMDSILRQSAHLREELEHL